MRGTPHKHGIRKWSTRNVTSHTPKICHSTVLYTIDIIYACNSFVSWGGTSDKECLQQKKQLIFCLPETGGGGEQYWSCLQKSKYELFCWAFYEKKQKQKSSYSGVWRHKGGGAAFSIVSRRQNMSFFYFASIPKHENRKWSTRNVTFFTETIYHLSIDIFWDWKFGWGGEV